MSAPVVEVVFLKASAKERAASLPAVGIWALTSALISLRNPFMEGTTSTKTVPAWKPAMGAPPPLVSCVVPLWGGLLERPGGQDGDDVVRGRQRLGGTHLLDDGGHDGDGPGVGLLAAGCGDEDVGDVLEDADLWGLTDQRSTLLPDVVVLVLLGEDRLGHQLGPVGIVEDG